MKTFLKDYVELCKEAGRFYKKHWKGAILFNAAIIGAEFAWFTKFTGTNMRKIIGLEK